MNKRVISTILISFLSISLIGCGDSKETETDVKEVTKQEETKVEETKIDVEPGITKEYLESKLKDIKIINISKDGDNYYTIDFNVRDVVSKSYYEKNILGEIIQISRVLSEASLVNGNEFFFQAKGPGKDKSGNEVSMNYATAFLKGDELKNCDLTKIEPDGMKVILESFGLNQSLK